MWAGIIFCIIFFGIIAINAEKRVNAEPKLFYRIANEQTGQGLWYDWDGKFTGLIHDEFNFCTNCKLAMDFDNKLIGYLSAADSRDTLERWFTEQDIKRLQQFGWCIHVYESDDYWFYDKFEHFVIKQNSMRLVETIKL